MRKKILALLIRMSTPYFDLIHADGSLYMGRRWLMPKFLMEYVPDVNRENGGEHFWRPLRWLPFTIRLHHIATPDFDTDLHDHPGSFVSYVVTGGYRERRPRGIEPDWERAFKPFHTSLTLRPGLVIDPPIVEYQREIGRERWRVPGSLIFRRATDRHRIVDVVRNTWTIFIMFRKVQWWGFYTMRGKVHWRDYCSVHDGRRS